MKLLRKSGAALLDPRGMSLVEMLVGMGITGLVMIALATLAFQSSRSFAAMTSYVEMDALNRKALDQLRRDIRQASGLSAFETNKISFAVEGGTLSYSHNPLSKNVLRQRTNEPDQVLLKDCELLRFSIYQRNPIGGTFEQHPVATAGTCKVVQLDWICARDILGKQARTEIVQSAKIVIRSP